MRRLGDGGVRLAASLSRSFLYYDQDGDEVYGIEAKNADSQATKPPELSERCAFSLYKPQHRLRWDEVAAKLETASKAVVEPTDRLGWVADMEADEQRWQAFASKRGAHYDEFKRLKEWRAARTGEEEDEEEDS